LEIQPIGVRNVVSQAVVSPKVFTPNGDGINDQATIDFTLFKVHTARPVTVSLHSLDGRQVRSITSTVTGGQQRFVWDGRDEVGSVVPPGMYIASIQAATDASSAVGRNVALLVGVAY
jgi:flagellar hook assembly protein FlgD